MFENNKNEPKRSREWPVKKQSTRKYGLRKKKPKAHLEKVDNVVIEEKRQVDVAQMVERPLPTTVANLINALRSQFMTLPRDVLKVDS